MPTFHNDVTYVGQETQVNTYTTSKQQYSVVSNLADGGYVVTWTSLGQDGNDWGVFAQQYDASGNPVGGEFQVNTYTTYGQGATGIVDGQTVDVTGLADGGYVITWQSNVQDTSAWGTYAQRYDANGNTVGGEVQVNTFTTSDQDTPSVASLSDGGYVIAWESYTQDTSGDGAYIQRYDASGTAVGGEVLVNNYVTSEQQNPIVTGFSDGGFIVTWSSLGQDTSGHGIYAQRFNADGTENGGEFLVNTTTAGDQLYQTVTELENGSFVISWQSYAQDGSGWGVFGQLYNADGTVQGGEFQINTYISSEQTEMDITSLADGGFFATWSSYAQDGSGWGIYGQRFDVNGNMVGDELQINTHTNSEQYRPSVTTLADGDVVVTWESYAQDGSGYGIYSQRLDFSQDFYRIDISQVLNDTDGSETLGNITIDYVPDGVVLSSGIDNGDGSWTLTDSELTDLYINTSNYEGGEDFYLTATASSTESSNSDTATTTQIFKVQVGYEDETSQAITVSGGTGDDIIIGSISDDTMVGGDGSDTFHVYIMDTGHDTINGGTGESWMDTIHLDADPTAITNWLTLDSGSTVDSGDNYVELTQDSSGHLDFGNGDIIDFTGIERIEW